MVLIRHGGSDEPSRWSRNPSHGTDTSPASIPFQLQLSLMTGCAGSDDLNNFMLPQVYRMKVLRSNWVPSSTAWERKTNQYSPLPMQHKKSKRCTTLCIRSKHLTLFEGVKECHFRDGPVHQTQAWIQAWYIQKHHISIVTTTSPERARRQSSKVEKPTPWCVGMVTIHKKSGPGVCVDHKLLNGCVLWEVCPLPKVNNTQASRPQPRVSPNSTLTANTYPPHHPVWLIVLQQASIQNQSTFKNAWARSQTIIVAKTERSMTPA